MDLFLAHPEQGGWHMVSGSADGSAVSDVQLYIFNTQGSYYLFAGWPAAGSFWRRLLAVVEREK